MHALDIADDGGNQCAGGMPLKERRRALQDGVIQMISQVGDQSEAGVVHQVGAGVVANAFEHGRNHQGISHDRPGVMEVRGNETLQVNRVVGAGDGEKANVVGAGGRIKYAVKNRAHEQQAKGVQQTHARQQHHRRNQLPPIRANIAQQARELPHRGAPGQWSVVRQWSVIRRRSSAKGTCAASVHRSRETENPAGPIRS